MEIPLCCFQFRGPFLEMLFDSAWRSGKSTALPGTPRKSGITSRKINQVIQIGAAQAKRAPPFHEEKISLPQFMEAFCAFRLAQNVEDYQVLRFR